MAMWTGGKSMEGEESLDIRNLFAAFEKQEKEAAEGYAKRGFWDTIGDIVKTIFPGVGHGIDFLVDTISQKLISVGDPSKLEAEETAWTGGQAGELAEGFRDIEKAATPTFVESILSQLVSYAGSEIGGKFLGDFQAGVKEYGLKDTMARTLGVGGKKFGEKVTAQGIADMPWLEGGDNWADFLSDPGAVAGTAGISNEEWAKGFLPQEGKPFSEFGSSSWEKGGYVPKYYGGGMVQGEVPTISDYFNRQGKSLGGSNNESLAEILGRK